MDPGRGDARVESALAKKKGDTSPLYEMMHVAFGLIWERIVKFCTVDVDDSEKHDLEYEAVRVALTDALLRTQGQRLPSRTVLTPLEEQWVSDVACTIVGAAHSLARPCLVKECGGMRFVRIIRNWLARAIHGYEGDADLCDAIVQDFQYVPVACGPHGDIQAISDRCVFSKSVSPSSSAGGDSE